jgi:hypothetical protein
MCVCCIVYFVHLKNALFKKIVHKKPEQIIIHYYREYHNRHLLIVQLLILLCETKTGFKMHFFLSSTVIKIYPYFCLAKTSSFIYAQHHP